MLVLAVDTTGPFGSAALLGGQRLLAAEEFEAGLNHSELLLPAVDRLLRSACVDIASVEGYAVAAGPGSFTGIRIGLATVKALAFASGRRVAAVSSLRALALKLRTAETGARLLCPMIDAKKGEIYAALFEAADGRAAELVLEGAYDPAEFLGRLPAGDAVHFIGTGAGFCRETIAAALGGRAKVFAGKPFIAREVGLLGLEALLAGAGVASEEVRPIYYRRSQAEERH
jgi:tRNA threonylcarbamoyladenosine biosynthesis protein TsaB